jgi:hypothetical protein
MRYRLFAYLCLIGMQFLCCGCAHYEFDLTRPSDLATHIGAKDVVIDRTPLEYRFNAVDNRLVMRIYNKAEDSIQLLGDQSTVVDPAAQSHPVRNAAIAPGSFIKLIFPPLGPNLERSGPSIGLGFGFVAASDRHWGWDDPFSDRPLLLAEEPRYLYVVDDRDLDWNWDGETDIRVSLIFEAAGGRFTHDFVFHRQKM